MTHCARGLPLAPGRSALACARTCGTTPRHCTAPAGTVARRCCCPGSGTTAPRRPAAGAGTVITADQMHTQRKQVERYSYDTDGNLLSAVAVLGMTGLARTRPAPMTCWRTCAATGA